MKHTILLLSALFITATNISAQNATEGISVITPKLPAVKNSISNYLSADTIISFTSETDLRGLVSNQWGNTVMFTTFTTNCKSDTVRLYSINAETFGVDTVDIYIADLRKKIKQNLNNKISNIAFNNSYLAINYASRLRIYKITPKQHSLYKDFEIDESPQEMQFLNDSILVFSNNYYSHTPPTFISLFNINTLKVEKDIFPHFNNLLLSYFNPHKNFDVKDNTILWANRAEYSFLVFNNNLELKDSIFHNVKDWKNLSEKTLKKALKRSKYDAADIIAIIEKEYFKIDQLQWAYLIDSTHILAVHAKPYNEKTYTFPSIDIFEKNNGQWQLTKTGIDDFAEQTDTIKRNSFALELLSDPVVHFTAKNKVVKLSKHGLVAEYPIGMLGQEYNIKEWDGWQNSDPFLQITIFSHTFAE